MKRIVLSLAACALTVGLVSAVRADEPATTSQTPSATKSTEPTTPAAKPAAPAKHYAVHHRAAHVTPIDLNAATKEELMKLPGVTEATADKIIGARPFKSSTELKTKSLVTKAEWAKIANRVVVKKES